MEYDLTKPESREETYLAKLTNDYSGALPDPISRIDYYLKKLIEIVSVGASGNEFTDELLEKLNGIETGANLAYKTPNGEYDCTTAVYTNSIVCTREGGFATSTKYWISLSFLID